MPTSFGNGTSVTSKALNTAFTSSDADIALKQNLPVGVAWTPTLSSGTWTNITFTGRYVQANKLVQFWILGTATGACVLGTGFNIPVLNFPVAPQSANAGGGFGTLITQGITTYTSLTDVGASSTIRPMAQLASGTYTTTTQLSSTVPITWALGNTILIQGTYEAS